MTREATRRQREGSLRDLGTCCTVWGGTSPTYRKKKASPLIRGSRSPLFKAVGGLVLLPSLLARVATQRGCIFCHAISRSPLFGCVSLRLFGYFAFIRSLL